MIKKIFLLQLACGSIMGLSSAPRSITFSIGKDVCIVTACSDHVLKVDYRPDDAFSPRTQMLDDSCVWDGGKTKVHETRNKVHVRSPFFEAEITKAPFEIVVRDPDGHVLLSQPMAPSGNAIEFRHNPADNYYGLSGYNRDTNQGVLGITRNEGGSIEALPQGGSGGPLIWSTSGYGVLLDTDGGHIDNADGVLTFTGCSRSNFEYYIIVGRPREILHSAGMLCGMPPMFPKWNCGFGQLEWGIDEPEFRTHVAGYRQRRIPFDWFMIDFDWMAWGEDDYGEFRWGPGFPGGPTGELKRWSDANGVKITGITKPRVIAQTKDGTFTKQYKYAVEQNFRYPGVALYTDYASGTPTLDLDFAIPECREWYWKHLCEGGFEKGVIGYLNDECDESHIPGEYMMYNFANVNMQKAIYEGQRAHTNRRVWSVNRTAYLGSQRYAYSVWSGDNFPNFADLQTQPGKMLTANNILMPIWGFCATAFWNADKLTPEFYIRSIQTSMFAPLFFLHGFQHAQKQPWFWGDEAVEGTRRAVELRYTLLPYLYSHDRQKHETMLGISRAIIIDYPDDAEAADMSEHFLFGDHFLVSPVMEEGISKKEVYFPQGTWIGWADGHIYEGGGWHTIAIDNHKFHDIPMYVRKGGIIPTREVTQWVGEREPETMFIDVFPSPEQTSFVLYDDDGDTYDYESGVYFRQPISQKATRKSVTIRLAQAEGSYDPPFDTYMVKVHYREAADVRAGGKKLKRFDTHKQLSNSPGSGYCVSKDHYGVVTYVKVPVRQAAFAIDVRGAEVIPSEKNTFCETKY